MFADGEAWRLVLGEALAVLPTLDVSEVYAVISDPPYGMDNDNDYARFTAGQVGHGKPTTRSYAPTVGDDRPFDPSPWLDFPRVVLWGCNHFAQRLPVGTTLVWLKRFEGGFGAFLSDAELAWMKGGHGVYCHRDTSMYSDPRKRKHPNEKPVGLMRWCLDMAKVPEGAVVLDPFCGSGTTGVACLQTGRRFVGIEMDEGYFKVAQKRLDEAANSAPLFDSALTQGRLFGPP